MDLTARRIGIGAGVGLLAGRAMDVATTAFRARQSDESRRREDELVPGGAPLQAARRLAGSVGVELDDARAARLGMRLHRGAMAQYGVVAAALAAAGTPPLRAGLATAAAGFLVVDEGMNAVLGPPPTAYSAESHLRGVVGHATLGLTTGLLLVPLRGALRGRRG